MPTRKLTPEDIRDATIRVAACSNSDHKPPAHETLEPGWYEHSCPGCCAVSLFFVQPKNRFG